jgi:hypothetical protein
MAHLVAAAAAAAAAAADDDDDEHRKCNKLIYLNASILSFIFATGNLKFLPHDVSCQSMLCVFVHCIIYII